jgi:hypothetical protein
MTDEIRVVTPGGVTKRYRLENAAVIRKLEDQSIPKLRTPQPLQTKTGKVAELDPSDDFVFLERAGSDEFGGILGDINRRGTTIELLVDSFQQAARDAEPSDATERISGSDRTLIQNAVDDVPELDRGTIELTAGDLQFDVHHASPALRMKLVREATGAEMRFNADQTVDYQSSVGADKTGTTLSPYNQQFVDSIRVDEETGPVTATHLRVIGADGSSADASITTTRITRDKWRRAYFRDTSDEATLQRRGETLLEELRDPWLQVRATLSDPPNGSIDPRPGDEYHVRIPGKDVDTDLTVREATARITPSDGDTYEVVLSNRTQTPDTTIEKLDQTARDTGGGTGGGGVSDPSLVGRVADDRLSNVVGIGSSLDGSLVFIPQRYDGDGVVIVDTSDAASPTVEARWSLGGGERFQAAAGTGNTMFATEEETEALFAVDVSDPSNPTQLDSLSLSTDGAGVAPHPSTDIVYAWEEGDVLRVVDSSDPSNLSIQTTLTSPGLLTWYVDDAAEMAFGLNTTTNNAAVADISTPTSPQNLGYAGMAALSQSQTQRASPQLTTIGSGRIVSVTEPYADDGTNELIITDI